MEYDHLSMFKILSSGTEIPIRFHRRYIWRPNHAYTFILMDKVLTWETISGLLALCEGNPLDDPMGKIKGPVMENFDILFDFSQNP